MTYEETLQYLYAQLPVFHNIGGAAYKAGLENTEKLLAVLNNPQRKYRTIHVAGTNGKGSVSHFLAAILQSAGYRTGLYTSPHLVDFGERIRVNGKMIEQNFVVDFVKKHKNLCTEIAPSFFELTMTMAFDYFADCQVDVAVIEVGLGGRLDSTNIIAPDLSVITNISLDHTAFLGNTLEEIAAEKAGIIKKNTPVVIGETQAETQDIFLKKAKKENAPILFADDQFSIFNFQFSISELKGIYQQKNIKTVLAAVEVLNKNSFYKISKQDIENGLANVVKITGLHGRWETLHEKPKIVADTGHNEGGIAENMKQLALETFDNLHFVFGMVNDKDVSAVLQLLPKTATYYFTQAQTQRAMKSTDLQLLAEKFALCGKSFETVEMAVKSSIRNAKSNDFIYIGGSNFVVGEALKFLNDNDL